MPDYPCRSGGGCKFKGCRFVHPGDPNYDQAIQKKEQQDRRAEHSSGRGKRHSDVTASNTIPLATATKWGKASPRKSSTGDANASSVWNFSEQSGQSVTNSNAGQSTEGTGNFSWRSTDSTVNNNASTSNQAGSTSTTDTSRATGDQWGSSQAWGSGLGGWGDSSGKNNGGGWGSSTWDNEGTSKSGNGGQWGSTEVTKTSNASDNGGWGTNKSGSGGQWGSTEVTKTSNASDNGGWGSNKSGSGGQWGSTEVTKTPNASDNGGWGTNKSGSGGQWGSNEVTKTSNASDNGGWGTSKPGNGGAWDNEVINTSNASDNGSSKPGNGGQWGFNSWDSQCGTNKSNDIQMLDSSRDVGTKHKSPVSPVQPTLRPNRAPVSSALSTKNPPDLNFLALELAKPRVKAKNKIQGAEDRKTWYQSLITHTRNAVIASLDDVDARADLTRWKDTQNSTIYAHATQKTRKILDSERTVMHRRLEEVEETFQKEVNSLINLPQSSIFDQNKKASNVVTTDDIVQYTQELQAWIRDLKVEKRLLVEKEEEEKEDGEVPDEEEEGEVSDPNEEVSKQKLSDLLRAGHSNWSKLTEAIETMEKVFDGIQTNFYFEVYTSIDGEMRETLERARVATVREPVESQKPQLTDLLAASERLSMDGKSLEKRSEILARCLAEASELEKKIEFVRRQKTEGALVLQWAEPLLEKLEQWKNENDARLAEIIDNVKQLQLHSPDPPSNFSSQNSTIVVAAAPPPISVPEPISSTDFIEPLQEFAITTIRNDLKTLLENLRFRCLENQRKLETELQEEATQITHTAEIIKTRLKTGGELATHHPVALRDPSSTIVSNVPN